MTAAVMRHRYIWCDYNEYNGAWNCGRMHGHGTFVWKTGERYDGEWRVCVYIICVCVYLCMCVCICVCVCV
jgi:MORN repeat